MRLRLLSAGFVMCGVLSVGTVWAETADDENPAIKCIPAKGLVKMFSKMNSLKPEQRDTIDFKFDATFKPTKGIGFPKRFYATDTKGTTDFQINAAGNVTNIDQIGRLSKKAELCIEHPAFEKAIDDGPDIGFDLGMSVAFKDRNGPYSLDVLKDGAKDGRSFYKKIVPGAVSFMVPKMTHVSIEYDDVTVPANIQAYKGDKLVDGLDVEPFGGTYVVSIEQIEILGADQLVVKGGAHRVEPSPSIEAMKKLGFTDEDAETGASEK